MICQTPRLVLLLVALGLAILSLPQAQAFVITSSTKIAIDKNDQSTELSLALKDVPFFAQLYPPAKKGSASITNRLPLGSIFDSREYIFSTATNVRGYEWTLKEAEELLDDLLDASNGFLSISRDSSNRDYELSQIVIAPMEWDKEMYGLGNKYDVHDGQQRLVTLCLLFAALRESFAKDGDMDDTSKELADMLNPPKVRKADMVRIELNKRDNEVLSYILKNDLKKLENIDVKKINRANKSIADNFIILSDRVGALQKDQRLKFLDYLVENVYMLVCVPESSTIARSLVMSQGKGKDNECIDDFKGLVCFRYNSEESDMYKTFDKWDDLAAIADIDNSSVGRKTVSDACMLRATAELREKIRKRDQLYALERWLRKDVIENKHEGHVFYTNKIEPACLVLGQYREGAFNLFGFYARSKNEKEWNSITMRLKFLREMTTSITATNDAEIVILELLLRANGSEGGRSMKLSDFDEYLHKTEQLALWIALTKPSATQKSMKILAFLDAIASPDDKVAYAEAISQEDKSFLRESLVVTEFGSNASGKRLAVILLKRMNAFVLAQQGKPEFAGEDFLESILPVKASKKSWGEDWPDLDEREKWVNNLGNLAIVSKKATSKQTKMPFSQKKERYNKEVLPLTLTVAEMDTWNSDNLAKNLATLVDLIDQIWGL